MFTACKAATPKQILTGEVKHDTFLTFSKMSKSHRNASNSSNNNKLEVTGLTNVNAR